MAGNNDYPILDGIAPSWADIQVTIASPDGAFALIDMADISAINSGVTVEVGEQRAGGRLKKRTTGSMSQEASWTLYLSGYWQLLRAIKSAAPSRGNQRLISLVHFLVDMSYTPPGSDEIYQRKLKGCRIMGAPRNDTEGTDAATVEMPLNPIEVVDVVDGEEVILL